jgi:propanediol dehydratase large subunit
MQPAQHSRQCSWLEGHAVLWKQQACKHCVAAHVVQGSHKPSFSSISHTSVVAQQVMCTNVLLLLLSLHCRYGSTTTPTQIAADIEKYL